VLHATSQQEAEEFRALDLRQPIAVIPNGVSLSPAGPRPSSPNSQPRTRTLLFLSRIHPKKGLLNLVSAWALARPNGWRVVIA
jgi:glycosyltransferase involved in cell wall biosynthesis